MMHRALAIVAITSLLLIGGAVAETPSGILRLSPDEYRFEESGSRAGTSGTSGIRTLALKGDPTQPGLYSILLSIPPNTVIAAHTHKDDRVATVVSGDWSIGYGPAFDASALKTIAPGGFYAEPPGVAHFARTGAQGAIVMITG